MGNADFPGNPPCLRCKRERKECVFVESKRGGHSAGFKHRRKSSNVNPIPINSLQGVQINNDSLNSLRGVGGAGGISST